MASEKQIEWAKKIKAEKIQMVKAYAESNGLTTGEDAELVSGLVAKMQSMNDSIWWINHRSPGWDTETLAQMYQMNDWK